MPSDCDSCKELQWELDDTKLKLDSSERAYRSLHAKYRNVGSKLTEMLEGKPTNPETDQLWQHYLQARGPRSGHAPILDDKRRDLMVKAIAEFTYERCERAITGLLHKPHVGSRGRSRTEYPGSKRRDGIEYALSDAKRLENCESFVDEYWALVNEHIHAVALYDYWGGIHAGVPRGGDDWVFLCPSCGDQAMTLCTAAQPNAEWRCSNGCSLKGIALLLKSHVHGEHRAERDAA